MKSNKTLIAVLFFVAMLFPLYILARSGCCSWHDGVCGCDTSVGRQVCCDGSYSPSCVCERKEKKPPPPPPPDPDKNVIKYINANLTNYYSSPHLFREILIKEILDEYHYSETFIATRVYRFMPDVK